jgi:hypothetical protein
MKLILWGNKGNLNGLVIIADFAGVLLEANLIYPYINKIKLDNTR